ncbi:TIGR02757 family protein [Dissulfurirhabdus thermomarina]|uniref:TIGR02757 family protein n=2 Tax=Dissulfurirhabdus thermomarina TaxID=1765737 RepID=A0A6N9TN43_DISTH|nr:TIGR02757 family protein [Dissulfurirhabdus thermomarina]NDY41493.1 TIGR02757 family protein [Dissulfurirhabdus thermomarina]NMX23880.1 TIGR02757 family protein [Dissulfurirhabdus thermomarina]
MEALYRRRNRRALVHPDPLEFLYRYPDVRDREVAGLVASALAYGRVRQILAAVGRVLDLLGPAPAARVSAAGPAELACLLSGFRHRFSGGGEVAALLAAAGRAIHRHGSLEACFRAGLRPGHETTAAAVEAFARELRGLAPGPVATLLPDPAKGSASKRLHLYLRWMVRRDDVDPGGWAVAPSLLLVPLDTHLHRMVRGLGFTRRPRPDLKAVLEVTAAFRRIRTDDPVRYDFALTRPGIRGGSGRPPGSCPGGDRPTR